MVILQDSGREISLKYVERHRPRQVEAALAVPRRACGS
jgi:hypothetical protein